MPQTVTCPKCNWPVPDSAVNSERLQPCPNCAVPLRVEVFPALFKPVEIGSIGEAILSDAEASCFYHPQKRAAVHCASCGRFLCALCDLDLSGQHMCPVCLESGQKEGKLTELESKRVLWENVALLLALVPLFVTGIAAIVIAIYGWNKPSSIVGRTHLRFYFVIMIALLQIAGWIALVILIRAPSGQI